MNEKIDWQSFKCRCSAINMMLANSQGNAPLTELQVKELADLEKKDTRTVKQEERVTELVEKRERSKKVVLSDTCINYLMEEYAWRTRGMVSVTKQLLDIPQMQKGTIVEPQSLALLSMVDGKFYLPNEDENGNRERIYNDYLSGEVDAYEGEAIMGANAIPDVKSNWDYVVFLNKIHESLTPANDWQIKGYLDISKAPIGFIANCLVDTPEEIINGTKFNLLRKLPYATEEHPKFKEKWEMIERSMRFKHIPPHQRVFKKNVEPMNDFERQRVYDKVKVCRDWLSSFDEMYQQLNK